MPTSFEYTTVWFDDAQSYTGLIATDFILIFSDGKRLPIDINRLRKEDPELYESIRLEIQDKHNGKVIL